MRLIRPNQRGGRALSRARPPAHYQPRRWIGAAGLLAALAAALLDSPAAAAAGTADAAYLSEARARAGELRLWEDPRWLALVHYRRFLTGVFWSEAKGREFFLSPRGRKDPRTELEATLAGFFDPEPAAPGAFHPQCRFPLRYLWLKERLGFDPARLPELACHGLELWRRKVDPGSVTLVFASSYLNSPASMYGHTFLRFDRKGHGEGERLLDQTLNFSAMVEDPDSFTYAWKGVTGGFEGRYSVMPYYIKVQEYSNLESRDLWEYRLALSSGAVDRIVLHAWELGSAGFPYFFLNKNCSYQLLPLLDIGEPGLRLTPRRPWWIIPAETVRAAHDRPRVVDGIRYRPSQAARMKVRRDRLTPPEARSAWNLARGDLEESLSALDQAPADRQALVLDAAAEYLLYLSGPRPDPEPEIQAREGRILARRGRLPAPALPAEPSPRPSPPHEGHRSGRVGLAAGMADGGMVQELSLRAALHDPLDPPEAYDAHGALEMGSLRIRHRPKEGRVYVQEFTVLRIASLSPWDSWLRPVAWEIGLGLDAAENLEVPPWDAPHLRLRGGAGLAGESSLWRRETAYALLRGDLGFGGGFRDGYRIGGGPAAGVLVDGPGRGRVQAEASCGAYAWGDPATDCGLRLGLGLPVGRDMGLRLGGKFLGRREELTLTIAFYR